MWDKMAELSKNEAVCSKMKSRWSELCFWKCSSYREAHYVRHWVWFITSSITQGFILEFSYLALSAWELFHHMTDKRIVFSLPICHIVCVVTPICNIKLPVVLCDTSIL